jgi:hypothetical protein
VLERFDIRKLDSAKQEGEADFVKIPEEESREKVSARLPWRVSSSYTGS